VLEFLPMGNANRVSNVIGNFCQMAQAQKSAAYDHVISSEAI
jgi:hypothetical protein